MNEIIQNALNLATIGQLSIEIQKRLASNTEVKIKPRWIRVQHTAHCDRLISAESVDHALELNFAAK